MHLRRRAIAQGLMWTPSVVAFKPALQSRLKLHQRSVFPQINLLILKAAPEPFDEHIIHPAPFAIHADADPEFGESLCPLLGGKLTTLIRQRCPKFGKKDALIFKRSGAWAGGGEADSERSRRRLKGLETKVYAGLRAITLALRS